MVVFVSPEEPVEVTVDTPVPVWVDVTVETIGALDEAAAKVVAEVEFVDDVIEVLVLVT